MTLTTHIFLLTDKLRDTTTTSAKFGFRFCGMSVFRTDEGSDAIFNKADGWGALEEPQLLERLGAFFITEPRRPARTDVIPALVKDLGRIKEFMERGQWEVTGSSVLLVYDADTSDGAHPPTAHAIDFVHATDISAEAGIDTNFVEGISSFIAFLGRLKEHLLSMH